MLRGRCVKIQSGLPASLLLHETHTKKCRGKIRPAPLLLDVAPKSAHQHFHAGMLFFFSDRL